MSVTSTTHGGAVVHPQCGPVERRGDRQVVCQHSTVWTHWDRQDQLSEAKTLNPTNDMNSEPVVIVSAARTPIGKHLKKHALWLK